MKQFLKAISAVSMCAMVAPAFGLDYPTLSNPKAQAFLQQYQRDRERFADPALFTMPSPAMKWPCAVEEIDQYKLAGVYEAHPEQVKASQKEMRKYFREQGLDPSTIGTTIYSGVQIALIRGECSAGKLNGPVELLGTYEANEHSVNIIPMGEKSIRSTTDLRRLKRARHVTRVEAGQQLAKGESTFFTQTTIQLTQHSDDAAMEAMERKMAAQGGSDKPTTSMGVVYKSSDGMTVSVIEQEIKKVTGGLFGVSVTPEMQLITMVMTPVGENRMVMESYTDKNLLSRSGMKDGKQHGESIMFMDNYLKPLKLRLDQQQGMENAREVVIDGKDMIETRTCYQNGVEIKTTSCPVE